MHLLEDGNAPGGGKLNDIGIMHRKYELFQEINLVCFYSHSAKRATYLIRVKADSMRNFIYDLILYHLFCNENIYNLAKLGDGRG